MNCKSARRKDEKPSVYVRFMRDSLGRPINGEALSLMIRLTEREWKWFRSSRSRKRTQAFRSALRRHYHPEKLELSKLPMYR